LAVNCNVFTLSPALIAIPLIYGGGYDVHILGNVYIPY